MCKNYTVWFAAYDELLLRSGFERVLKTYPRRYNVVEGEYGFSIDAIGGPSAWMDLPGMYYIDPSEKWRLLPDQLPNVFRDLHQWAAEIKKEHNLAAKEDVQG